MRKKKLKNYNIYFSNKWKSTNCTALPNHTQNVQNGILATDSPLGFNVHYQQLRLKVYDQTTESDQLSYKKFQIL